MEEENAKEDNQPSKKESQRMTSDQDLYNERRKYEERRNDQMSNSESFTSASYSGRSRIDMAGVRPEIPKAPAGKREAKPTEKKRRGRRPGRVEKRRRSPARRAPTRRVPKKKPPRKERELSVSTIFTRLSSQSGERTPGCKFCGHRCCRRR